MVRLSLHRPSQECRTNHKLGYRGRLVKDRASGQPKLNCRNWECGVLIPVSGEAVGSGLGAFEKKIPVPMVVPGEAYGKAGTKRPWFFLEA